MSIDSLNPKYFRKFKRRQYDFAQKYNLPLFSLAPKVYEVGGCPIDNPRIITASRRLYVFESEFVILEYHFEVSLDTPHFFEYTDVLINGTYSLFSEAIAIKQSMCGRNECDCDVHLVKFLHSFWFIKGGGVKLRDIVHDVEKFTYHNESEFYFSPHVIAVDGNLLTRPRHIRQMMILFSGVVYGCGMFLEHRLYNLSKNFERFKSVFFGYYYWSHPDFLLEKNPPNLLSDSLYRYIFTNLYRIHQGKEREITFQTRMLLVALDIEQYTTMRKYFSEAPFFPYPELSQLTYGMAFLPINYEIALQKLSAESKELLTKMAGVVKEKIKKSGESNSFFAFSPNYAFTESGLIFLHFQTRGGGYVPKIQKLLIELTRKDTNFVVVKTPEEVGYRRTSAKFLYFLNPEHPYLSEILTLYRLSQNTFEGDIKEKGGE